jgi:hypothetical protein
MKARSILLNTCLILTALCLAAGFMLAGYWLILPVLLAIFLLWFLARNKAVFWSASGLLLAMIALAAIGILLGLSRVLMLVACTAALVSWDLIQFTHSIPGIPQRESEAALERYHLQSLALTAFPGFLLAVIGSYVNLDLPFILIIFLVLVTMGGLGYSLQFILKKNT